MTAGSAQRVRVCDKDSSDAALVGPNDATSDGKGGAYLTTSGPWESPIVGKAVADDRHYANGIQLSADGKLLYVNESEARASSSSPLRCRRTAA